MEKVRAGEPEMRRELKIFPVVNNSIQAHVPNPRVFGNDSVIRVVLYQSQLGHSSGFCPVLMPVKKGRLKVPFFHQFLKQNVTDFETINSK